MSLGPFAIFFVDGFYPWLLMLTVAVTSMIMAAKA